MSRVAITFLIEKINPDINLFTYIIDWSNFHPYSLKKEEVNNFIGMGLPNAVTRVCLSKRLKV